MSERIEALMRAIDASVQEIKKDLARQKEILAEAERRPEARVR
jgi:hypothetical protein